MAILHSFVVTGPDRPRQRVLSSRPLLLSGLRLSDIGRNLAASRQQLVGRDDRDLQQIRHDRVVLVDRGSSSGRSVGERARTSSVQECRLSNVDRCHFVPRLDAGALDSAPR